jgi:hypothetical protein
LCVLNASQENSAGLPVKWSGLGVESYPPCPIHKVGVPHKHQPPPRLDS